MGSLKAYILVILLCHLRGPILLHVPNNGPIWGYIYAHTSITAARYVIA